MIDEHLPSDWPAGFAAPGGWQSGWHASRGANDDKAERSVDHLEEPLKRADPTRRLPLPVELFAEIRPQLSGRYLIKGLLRASSSMTLFGLPGTAKSFLAVSMGLHIAASRDWFGRKVTGGGVAYIGAEGQAGLRARVEAAKLAHGFNDLPFALIPTAVDLLDPAADMEKLRKVLDYLEQLWGGFALLIIDTLAATFGGGDENGSDMAAYVANVERLCAPYGCARIIVAHAPLNTDAKRPRGHGSLWGSMDTVLHVTGDRDAPARRVHVLKQKDDDPGPDILFNLVQVEIGTDEDGDPVTSCVIEESDVEPTTVRAGRRLSPKERIVFQALERAVVAKGMFPPAIIPENVCNRARTGKVASLSEWRSEALSALSTSDTKPDTARRNFDRARDSLQASEIIAVWEDWAWLV